QSCCPPRGRGAHRDDRRRSDGARCHAHRVGHPTHLAARGGRSMTATPSSALWPLFVPPRDHDRLDLRLAAASGVRVRLADGRELIDGASGLWNVNLGYGNPRITDAVAEAMRDASYLTTFRYSNTWAEHAATV